MKEHSLVEAQKGNKRACSMSHGMRKPVFGGLRPGKTQTSLLMLSYRNKLQCILEIWYSARIDIILFKERSTKALIRLCYFKCF